jgi:two-component system alkaline phosphatase synthesis response regulator PhoP
MSIRSEKILIADDEPDILEILKYNLNKEGYEVITAKDGDEAIAKARQSNPDLVILDIMMPRKNGVEVCEILRAQPQFKDTLILFLTALSDEATQIKGLTMGADDYVSKPISQQVFLSKVNALFRRLGKKESKVIEHNDLIIDPEKYIVVFEGKEHVLATFSLTARPRFFAERNFKPGMGQRCNCWG